MSVSLRGKLWKSLSCVQYFILSFSSSLCCPWKGSGTWSTMLSRVWISRIMSLWWLWDHNSVLTQTTVTMARSHDLLQPHSFFFSRSMFSIMIWEKPHDFWGFTQNQPTNHHKAGRRRKTAAPQSALSSGALHRCCSTLDPNPAEDPTQHYCIFFLSRWPLTSWKAVFGNTLLTLHARLHRPAEGLFRFWLSTLFLYPLFNSVSQGSEVGGSWMADTKQPSEVVWAVSSRCAVRCLICLNL